MTHILPYYQTLWTTFALILVTSIQPYNLFKNPLRSHLDGIVKFMRAQVGPSSKDLLTVADFEAFTAKDDVVVIGFFEKESDLKGDFLKTADKLREEVIFAHSSAKEVLNKVGYK